ncbi:MAG: hypothetical protein R6U84_04155, partial [Candidatus Cloacimonadales bacterium]
MKKIVIAICAIIIVGCSIPDNLGLPSWETNLKFYLINSNYPATELAEADSSFIASGDTLKLYNEINESQLVEFTADSSLSEEEEAIDDISINNPQPVYSDIPLSEFAPDLVDGFLPAPGVAPFTLPEIIKDDLEPFDQFLEVSCISGLAEISVLNNTAIWFGDVANDQPLIIAILDNQGSEITRATFSEDVPPFATATISETIDLAGVTMVNDIQLKVLGGSRGTDGEAAEIETAATLEIEVEISAVLAEHAIAIIPAQDVTETIEINIDDEVIIQEAIIADNGYEVNIEFENSIDLDILVEISIEKLFLAGEEEAFMREVLIPRSGGAGLVSTHIETVDISGATLGDGTDMQELIVEVNGFTDDTIDDYREINSSDYFSTVAEVGELEFAYFEGILLPREQDTIESEEILDIDYPFIIGDFAVTGYSEIRLEIDTPFFTKLSMQITGYNDTNNQSLLLSDLENGEVPVIEVSAGQSTVVFSSEQYNLNEFISILPERIVYSIEPIVGHETEVNIYHAGDSLSTDVIVEAELDIDADCIFIPKDDEGEPNLQKVETENITQKEIDAFSQGSLQLSYFNTLGFSVATDIIISAGKELEFSEIAEADS